MENQNSSSCNQCGSPLHSDKSKRIFTHATSGSSDSPVLIAGILLVILVLFVMTVARGAAAIINW